MTRSLEELKNVRVSDMTAEERSLVIAASFRKLKGELESPAFREAVEKIEVRRCAECGASHTNTDTRLCTRCYVSNKL